jgi:hypothetical protein
MGKILLTTKTMTHHGWDYPKLLTIHGGARIAPIKQYWL